MVERLWCTVCQRGIDGVNNETCPECISLNRGKDSGILKTPEQASKEHLELANAIKLTKNQSQVRGQKTMDERMSEMKTTILDEIKKQFDLVPKKDNLTKK